MVAEMRETTSVGIMVPIKKGELSAAKCGGGGEK
jgi:hypothetical protein